MESIFIYILKANGLLLFFWMFYKIFLQKETFYTINRWYFISTLLISFILPLIYFTKVEEIVLNNAITSFDSNNVMVSNQTLAPVQQWYEHINWLLVLFIILAAISFIRMVLRVHHIAKMIQFITKLPVHNLNKTIRLSSKDTTVYSFYKWIVVPKEIVQNENYSLLLQHETIHLTQKHTFDLVLISFVIDFFWFNPFLKMLRKDMNLNLEFLVDAKIATTENSYLYQKSLLQYQQIHPVNELVNAFQATDLKKRILQLNTQKSNHMKKLKFLLATPALFAFFGLFQIETVAQITTLEVQEVFENDKVEDSFYIMIHSSYDDAYYERTTKMLREKCNLNVKIDNLKRNKEGELTSVRILLPKNTTPNIIGSYKKDEPFSPFNLHVFKTNNGYDIKIVHEGEVGYSEIILDEDNTLLERQQNKETLSFDEDILRTNRKIFNEVSKKFAIEVDGVLMSKKDLKKFDNKTIKTMTLSFDNRIKNTPTIVLSTKETLQKKTFTFIKTNDGDIKINGKEATQEEINTNEPLRLRGSLFNNSQVNIFRINHNPQYRTIEETYVISKNGDGSNSKRTVYKDADGKVVKIEDSNDNQQLSNNKIVIDNLMYVVDGTKVLEDDFRSIHPNDIESITVLKDKESKEKYNALFKDGILVITTKKNKATSSLNTQKTLKAKETALLKREYEVKKRKELEKQRQQLLTKQSESKKDLENRKREIEKLKQIKEDLKITQSVFNEVKRLKTAESENFKITSISTSLTRDDGSKVELTENY